LRAAAEATGGFEGVEEAAFGLALPKAGRVTFFAR